MAQEFGRVAAGRFPVLLQGESDRCDPVPPTKIADDEIAGIFYVFTYSEQNRFSCVTSYIVPVNSSKFAHFPTFSPQAEWATGPRIERPLPVLPIARNVHIFAAAYFESLNWRVEPHFPISEKQASTLAPQHYESRTPSIPSDTKADIHVDFEEARALVRQEHERLNFRLSWLITLLGSLPMLAVIVLAVLYKKCAEHLAQYWEQLSVSAFILADVNHIILLARTRHLAAVQQQETRKRQQELQDVLRKDLEEKLRSMLGNLPDCDLRKKLTDCLNIQPVNVNQMQQLWAELQEILGQRSPAERLALLLESLKPYCTHEELSACHLEASGILEKAGFRAARNYVIAMHDQFRIRMRQMEEAQNELHQEHT